MTFAGSAREDAPPREAGLNFVFVTACCASFKVGVLASLGVSVCAT
jgi:hypothetical protein